MADKEKPRILTTVRFDGGEAVGQSAETFAPGQEDELEEFLDEMEEDEDAGITREAVVDRLTAKGYISGFGSDVELDDTAGDIDQQITRRAVRRREVSESVEEEDGSPAKRRRPAKKAAKKSTKKVARRATAEEEEEERLQKEQTEE